jgi:hypothetical protein
MMIGKPDTVRMKLIQRFMDPRLLLVSGAEVLGA